MQLDDTIAKLKSLIKNGIHCAIIVTLALYSVLGLLRCRSPNDKTLSKTSDIIINLLYALRLLGLPFTLSIICGLLLFNSFPTDVKLKSISNKIRPKISFRIVTKGSYPNLVKINLRKNIEICAIALEKNYLFEIVTEVDIKEIENSAVVRKIVVPSTYTTKKGARFKARNLQYCLEDSVNILDDDDWIVHLDEDSLLTTNAIYGILNFILERKHYFGNGIINYNYGCDSSVLSKCVDFSHLFSYGILRFQLKCFGKCLFFIKTTYLVANVKAEKDVTFDMEKGHCLTEDIAFGFMCRDKNYAFGFVEGEVLEQGCYSLIDACKRQNRLLAGLLNILQSQMQFSKLYVEYIVYTISLLSIVFELPYIYCSIFLPTPSSEFLIRLNILSSLMGLYLILFNAIKFRYTNISEFVLLLFCTFTFGYLLRNVCWSFLIIKNLFCIRETQFYISKKSV